MSAPEGLEEGVTYRMGKRQENSPSQLPGGRRLRHTHVFACASACMPRHTQAYIHLLAHICTHARIHHALMHEQR